MNPLVGADAAPPLSPVIVALDFTDPSQALAFASRLDPLTCRVKVGKALFTASGRQLVEALAARGFQVFLDLKFHDIPNTVAQACQVAADIGVWMLNVHAAGGRRMMEAAREALVPYAQRPLLIAVTVLTSIETQDLTELGIDQTPAEQALCLARLAQACALDGVVCSAQEAPRLRRELAAPFVLVTPGIRLASIAVDDQRRVATPIAALAGGADYLVIGRPVTSAVEPLQVLYAINQEIAYYQAQQQ